MQHQLQIYMLGKFEVILDDVTVLPATARNSKLVQLLEYLVCRRGVLVSQKELVDNVLHEEAENPAVVLKNLVYRLRKMFAEVTDAEVIGSMRNAYGFVPKMICDVDLERFLALEQSALDPRRTAPQRLESCMEAIGLYAGPLLPKTSAELWVMKRRSVAESLYVRCLTQAYEICSAQGDEQKMLPHLARACQLMPYYEGLQYMHVEALYQLRKTSEALRQYETFARLLYDDLCTMPSERLREIHKKILEVLQPTAAHSVAEVRDHYFESEDQAGAFYCPPEVFSRLFQYAVRQAQRNGQTVTLVLCTLTETDGRQPAGGDRLRETAQNLNESIASCCRAGDAYTRNSPSQFTLLLAGTDDVTWNLVAQRIQKAFYSRRGMRHLRLLCEGISALDFEHLNGMPETIE